MQMPEGFQLDWASETAGTAGTASLAPPATVRTDPFPPFDHHYHGQSAAHVTTAHVGTPSFTTMKPAAMVMPPFFDIVIVVCLLVVLALLRLQRALAPRPP